MPDVSFYDTLISIHTPLAGSDPVAANVSDGEEEFQSTLPLRGATNPWDETNPAVLFQSTLPLRGATAEMRHF